MVRAESTAAHAALVDRLRDLTSREDRITRHLRGQDGRHDEQGDDYTSFVSNDPVLEGLEDAALTEITEIQDALLRLEHGTYGFCEDCGDPIDMVRLSLLPHARRCAMCEQDEETLPDW